MVSKKIAHLFYIFCLSLLLNVCMATEGKDEPSEGQSTDLNTVMTTGDIAYYELSPEFTTNIAGTTQSGKLHYIRLKVIIMLKNSTDLKEVSRREPLLRDTIITILGSKTFNEVSSSEGRETIRQECRNKITQLIDQKIGHPTIQDVLFVNYLYQ